MNECQWPSQLKTTIIFFEIVFASKPQGNKPLSKWNNYHNLKSKIGNTFPFLQFFCCSVITKSGKQRFHGITILGFFLVIKRENIFNLKPLNFIPFTWSKFIHCCHQLIIYINSQKKYVGLSEITSLSNMATFLHTVRETLKQSKLDLNKTKIILACI